MFHTVFMYMVVTSVHLFECIGSSNVSSSYVSSVFFLIALQFVDVVEAAPSGAAEDHWRCWNMQV